MGAAQLSPSPTCLSKSGRLWLSLSEYGRKPRCWKGYYTMNTMTTVPREASISSSLVGLPGYAVFGLYVVYSYKAEGFSPAEVKFVSVAVGSYILIVVWGWFRKTWCNRLVPWMTRRQTIHARSFEFITFYVVLVGLMAINFPTYGSGILSAGDSAGFTLWVGLLVIVALLLGLNMYPCNVPTTTRGLEHLHTATLDLLRLSGNLVVTFFILIGVTLLTSGVLVGGRALGMRSEDVLILGYLFLGAVLMVATLGGRLTDLLWDLNERFEAEEANR